MEQAEAAQKIKISGKKTQKSDLLKLLKIVFYD